MILDSNYKENKNLKSEIIEKINFILKKANFETFLLDNFYIY